MNDFHKLTAVSKDATAGSVTDVNALLQNPNVSSKRESPIFGFVMALIEAHRFVQNRRSALNDPLAPTN